MSCKKCDGSGKVTADAKETPYSAVVAKEKEGRPQWKGLVDRTSFKVCDACIPKKAAPFKRGPGRPRKVKD